MKEASLAFGPGGGLVGTLTLPSAGISPAGIGQVLFNAGVVHRVGPHRLNVQLARRLAAHGIPTIRFDLSGQGDSARATGTLGFDAQAGADLSAAMDALAQAAGVSRFSLFGFCSGGCHSYAAAQADPRVMGLILYDTYIWRTPRSRLNRYLESIRHRGFARAVGGWLGRQPASLSGWFGNRDAAATFESGNFTMPTPDQFAEVVRRLRARGAKVGLIHTGGFADFNYAAQFHDAFRGFGLDDDVSCDYFPDLGHSATVIPARQALVEHIVGWTRELDERLRREARSR